MSEGEKRCEACGNVTAEGRHATIGKDDKAWACGDCWHKADLHNRIEVARRSAQSAVERAPLSADGREIRVGDRVVHIELQESLERNGTSDVVSSTWRSRDGVEMVGLDFGESRFQDRAHMFRHLAPIAARGEKAKCEGGHHVGGFEILGATRSRCCGCNAIYETPGGSKAATISNYVATEPPGPSLCWEHGGPFVGACPECVWERLSHRQTPSQGALEEVEMQLALVARLDFDLFMLKLLGQGWSRGDLRAHIGRMSRAAEKPRGGG